MSRQKFQKLICPIDGLPLLLDESQLICESGHCFDLAKQGYVNLLPVQYKKSLAPGDSKAMVAARSRFLHTGVYLPVLNQLISTIEALTLPKGARILDAGCGEGYYTKQLALRFPEYQFIGLDISKEALRFASKKDDSIDWLVASNSQPPLVVASIDLILCIFGFHSFVGFNKVLKPEGTIVLVDPDQDHLIELRNEVYEQVNLRSAYSVDDASQQNFSLRSEQRLTFSTADLEKNQIQDLLLMTPHLFRASALGKTKAEALDHLTLTVDMLFRTLRFVD